MNCVLRLLALAGLAVGLAACQSAYFGPQPGQPSPTRSSIEGNWVDPNGIISSFRGGVFQTRTTDSNALLATGNYRYVTADMVEIDLTSLLRQTNSRVNCAIVSARQLNCTASDGAQFSLTRTV